MADPQKKTRQNELFLKSTKQKKSDLDLQSLIFLMYRSVQTHFLIISVARTGTLIVWFH